MSGVCLCCGAETEDEFDDRPVEGPAPAPTRVSATVTVTDEMLATERGMTMAYDDLAARLRAQCPDGFELAGPITAWVRRLSDEDMMRRARSWAIDYQMLHGAPPPSQMPRVAYVLGEAPIAMRVPPRSETTG